MEQLMIKLLNGKEVTLDEFMTWSSRKQSGNLSKAYQSRTRNDAISAHHKMLWLTDTEYKNRLVAHNKRMKNDGALQARRLAASNDADGNLDTNGEKISAEQIAEIERRLEDTKGNQKRFYKYMKIAEIADLPASRYQAALDAIAAADAKRKATA